METQNLSILHLYNIYTDILDSKLLNSREDVISFFALDEDVVIKPTISDFIWRLLYFRNQNYEPFFEETTEDQETLNPKVIKLILEQHPSLNLFLEHYYRFNICPTSISEFYHFLNVPYIVKFSPKYDQFDEIKEIIKKILKKKYKSKDTAPISSKDLKNHLEIEGFDIKLKQLRIVCREIAFNDEKWLFKNKIHNFELKPVHSCLAYPVLINKEKSEYDINIGFTIEKILSNFGVTVKIHNEFQGKKIILKCGNNHQITEVSSDFNKSRLVICSKCKRKCLLLNEITESFFIVEE